MKVTIISRYIEKSGNGMLGLEIQVKFESLVYGISPKEKKL